MHTPCLMEIGESLAQRFCKSAETIDSEAAKIHRQPSKSSVHDLRVAIRRARAVLWIARRGPNNRKLNKLNRQLRKMNHHLGQVRELDVVISDSRKFNIKTGKLKKRRKKLRRKLADSMSPKVQRSVHRKLMKAASDVEQIDESVVSEGRSQLRGKIHFWQNADLRRKNEVHRFRIFVKRLRYISEALGQNTKSLAKLQDELGLIHDLEVLGKLTGVKKERPIQPKQWHEWIGQAAP